MARPIRREAEVPPPTVVGVEWLGRLMFWPPSTEPAVLEALGVWNAQGGSGGHDAWRVLLNAVAESGMEAPRFTDRRDPQELKRWLSRNRDQLDALKRCWRVEAARADLLGLWDAIDNDASANEFRAQYDRWAQASVSAARSAVAAWSR